MGCSVTFINHATLLIDFDGMRILTDPVFSWTVSYFLPRLKKPGISLDRLPPIDIILISHDHYDHLNLRSLRRLRRKHQSLLCTARGLGKYATRSRFRDYRELEWWESFETASLTITSVPARHISGRKPWDHNESGYCGFVVEAGDCTVYFAGDSGYGEHFAEISRRFSIDIALLPIGAYKPYEWFKNIHMTPHTALQAFVDLKARHLIPVHWGTFKISDEPMAEPPQLLQQEAERLGFLDKVHILDNGESFSL